MLTGPTQGGIYDVYFIIQGGSGVGNIDWFEFSHPAKTLEAEKSDNINGVKLGSIAATNTDDGDWVVFSIVDLGVGYTKSTAKAANTSAAGKTVEIHQDRPDDPHLF